MQVVAAAERTKHCHALAEPCSGPREALSRQCGVVTLRWQGPCSGDTWRLDARAEQELGSAHSMSLGESNHECKEMICNRIVSSFLLIAD